LILSFRNQGKNQSDRLLLGKAYRHVLSLSSTVSKVDSSRALLIQSVAPCYILQ